MKDKKVLAIKYRPVVLDDLLGQEVVSRMKHRQKNKKVIKIYRSEQLRSTHLPASHKVLLEVGDYKIIKEDRN